MLIVGLIGFCQFKCFLSSTPYPAVLFHLLSLGPHKINQSISDSVCEWINRFLPAGKWVDCLISTYMCSYVFYCCCCSQDLVKSHLMITVRAEVAVLKEQIKELKEKNSKLEYENSILKAAASQETLAKLSQPWPVSLTDIAMETRHALPKHSGMYRYLD